MCTANRHRRFGLLARPKRCRGRPTRPCRQAVRDCRARPNGPPSAGTRSSSRERHSVRGQILTALREALLSGELVPGEVYSAPALAERFGVSATPVREAMQRLESEGAVETVPNRGFRVAVCSARDLAELAEIRALLEIPSLLEAARSMPPECWESLRPYAEEALAAAAVGDRATYALADCAFHGALLELTGTANSWPWPPTYTAVHSAARLRSPRPCARRNC